MSTRTKRKSVKRLPSPRIHPRITIHLSAAVSIRQFLSPERQCGGGGDPRGRLLRRPCAQGGPALPSSGQGIQGWDKRRLRVDNPFPHGVQSMIEPNPPPRIHSGRRVGTKDRRQNGPPFDHSGRMFCNGGTQEERKDKNDDALQVRLELTFLLTDILWGGKGTEQ